MLLGVRWHSLRAKIIAWAFIPTAIILAAVLLVAIYAYQQVTEDLVVERNRELARLSANQLSDALDEYVGILEDAARNMNTYQSDMSNRQAALETMANPLTVFDGGVAVLDSHGAVVALLPRRLGAQRWDWSSRPYFRRMIETPGPVFSDELNDGPNGAPVVGIAVPVIGYRGEFNGAVVGMFRVGSTTVSAFYGTIVKLRIEVNGGSAYLVDGAGRVIYHTDTERIGADFGALAAVQRVIEEDVGALRTRNLAEQEIIASYAPVPHTSWGLVTEMDWSALLRNSQGYGRFLLILLALGVVVPAIVVAIGARRITQPVADLIDAAQEVASGNFGHTVIASTGDEIEDLVTQFNAMSSELLKTYTALREREERFDLAMRGTNDGIWDWDLETNEVYFSPRWKSMLGYADNEVASRFDEWLRLMHPADASRVQGEVQDYLAGRSPVYRVEHRLRHRDGSYRWILARGIVLRRADGTPYRMAGSHSDITDQKLADEALRERLEFESLVASISTRFLNLGPEEVDAGIWYALETVGRFAQVDRACVFRLSPDQGELHCAQEWYSVDGGGASPVLQKLPMSDLHWLRERVMAMQTVPVPSLADMPPEAAAERNALEAEGIVSVLIIPMVYGGVPVGFFGLASSGTAKEWSEQAIASYRIVAEIIVNAMEHKRAQDALQQSYQTLEVRVEERTRELSSLLEISRNVASTLQLEPLLDLVLTQLRAVIDYVGASVLVLEDGQLRVVAYQGPIDPDEALQISFGLEPTSANHAVMMGKQPVIVADTRADTDMARGFRQTAGDGLDTTFGYIRSWMGVPLIVKDQVIGMLSLDHQQPGFYTEEHAELTMAFAHQVAIALENARHFAVEERRADQFRMISEVGRRITSILDVDRLLAEIAQLLKDAYGCYMVTIGMVEGDEVVHRAGVGPYWDDPQYQFPSVKLGEQGITGWVAKEGVPLLVPDVERDPRYHSAFAASDTKSEMAVPLVSKGEVIGVLNVEDDRLNAFDETDLSVLQSLAQQAAIAIENARNYERAQEVAILEERQRLARDLHDSVTQALYGVTLYAEAASRQLEADQVQRASDHLRMLGETAREALQEMRLLIYELRPPLLEQEGIVAAIRARLDAVEGRTGMETSLESEGEIVLSSRIEKELYRIAQETLNNVLKHARAKTTRVRLAQQDDRVILEVVDDGIGFDADSPKGGLGLAGIGERVGLLGGEIQIESAPGQGTRVQVIIPLS